MKLQAIASAALASDAGRALLEEVERLRTEAAEDEAAAKRWDEENAHLAAEVEELRKRPSPEVVARVREVLEDIAWDTDPNARHELYEALALLEGK